MVDWIQALVTGSIAGLFTFLALFLANHLLDLKRYREKRPIIKISSEDNPSIVMKPIKLSLYNVTRPDLPSDIRKVSRFDLEYKVNRIKVENNGISAAKDCKGMIIQDGQEMNVCWNIPSERYKMTINAKSHEYLDLCGFLSDNPSDKVEELKNNVSSLREQYTLSDNQTRILEPVPGIKHDFLEQYPEVGDNPKIIEKYFPFIIAPTENSWQNPPNLNWILKPGPAIVRITSMNAAPIEYNIKILDKLQNDIIIEMISEKKVLKHKTKKN